MPKEQKVIKLCDFLDEFKEALVERVVNEYPPLYDPETDRKKTEVLLSQLKRRPFVAQADTVNALANILQSERSAIVVGEMGVGKTLIGITVSHVLRAKKTLVCCPPHLTKKWEREVKSTLPFVRVVHLRDVQDMYRLEKYYLGRKFKDVEDRLFCIVSRERAKLGFSWKASAIQKKIKDTNGTSLKPKKKVNLRERVMCIATITVLACPRCGV